MTDEATKELISRAASILEEISDTFIICVALDQKTYENDSMEALICANGGKEQVRSLAVGTAKRICSSEPDD